MHYYICSTLLCATKINGEYKGESDCNLATVCADEKAFFEFLPMDNEYAPSCFQIDLSEQLLEKGYRCFPFENGALIMPIFTKKYIPIYKSLFDFDLKECFAKIFIDGHCKLLVTNNHGANVFTLPFIPLQSNAQILNFLLILTLKSRRKQIAICIDLRNQPVLKFIKEIKSISIESNGFLITQSPNSITDICICENYSTAGDLLSKNVTRSKSIERLNLYLIPFSFLEEVLYNGAFSDYLHQNLLPHAGLIKKFLGDFLSFIPYVKNDNLSAVLITEKKARKINFILKENKILDFLEI